MSSSSRFGHIRRNTGRPTNRPPVHVWIPAGVLVLASLGVTSPALARSNFDGDWSVVIETRGGACVPTLRYPLAITNGIVTNSGDSPAAVQGRVAPSGAVRVTVQVWRVMGQRLWPPDDNRRQRRLARAGHKRSVRGHMASTAPQLWRSSDTEWCANL